MPPPFSLRPFLKADLATRYYPGIDRNSARKRFMREIHTDRRLMQQLRRAGYYKKCKYLPAPIVRIIVRVLEEPP